MSSTTKLHGVVARGGDVPQVDPTKVIIVGLDKPDSDEYWFAYCPRAADPPDVEMIEAFRATNEVTDPIKVRRDGDAIVVLDGRRRVKAAREIWKEQAKAGKPERDRVCVRIIVAARNDEEAARVNRDGNEGRLDYTPVQKALQLAHFAKFMRGSKEELGKKMGITGATVRNLTAILECAPRVQKAIDDKVIAYSHAPALAKLDRAEQVKLLDKMIEKGATKGHRARAALEGRDVGEKMVKMLSRKLIELLREGISKSLPGATAAPLVGLLDYVLGDKSALKMFEGLKTAAEDALPKRAEKKPKVPKPPKPPKAPKVPKEKKRKGKGLKNGASKEASA